MLDAFRQKGVTSIVYGGLIVATVVVFVIQFRPGAQGKSGSIRRECAAEIRGRCIDPKEYYAELYLVAPSRMIEGSQLKRMGIRRAVLDGLVERTLLAQDAARVGIVVSDQEIDDELVLGRAHVSLPADKAASLAYALRLTEDLARVLPVQSPETKRFDYKTYEKIVRQYTNRSPGEFKEWQREELQAARMRDLVRARVRVSDAEAFDAFVRDKSTASIRYVRLARSWFARVGVDQSDAGIDEWAKKHEAEVGGAWEARKAQYLPECLRARHILARAGESATDEEKQRAREKIERAAERVRKGERFEDVAREAGEDGTAPEGGSLGCFARGRMVKPFEDAAFALEAGKTSGVVETAFGFHLIRSEGLLKGAEAEAFGRRETARALFVGREGDALVVETAKRILAAARAGKALDQALSEALAGVEEAGQKARKERKGEKAAGKQPAPAPGGPDRPKVEDSAPFNAGGDPIPGVATGQDAAELAMKIPTEGGLADDLVKLEDGWAIVQLKERSVPSRDQYDKERDTVMAALLAAKQADALVSYVARLKDAAKGETRVNDAYAKAPEKERDED